MSLKVVSVVGTRPNFVKEFLVQRELKLRGVHEVIVHTGQHYDYEMSKAFFESLEIPEPDYHFEIPQRSKVCATAHMMLQLEEVLQKERPDVTLVYGDVNSAAAGALVSGKMKVPVAHVEGGIRTPSLENPEEINRRVADVVSDVIFTCTPSATRNLELENVDPRRICESGDLMKDALETIVAGNEIPVERGEYLVVTIHREENCEDRDRLREIVEALVCYRRQIHFPVHPRTRKKLVEFDLIGRLEGSPTIDLTVPTSYPKFLQLLAGADKVLTDSGGVRREAFLLGKPTIVPIDLVWFPEILEAGWKLHVEPDRDELLAAIENFEPTGDHRPEIFGNGQAHRKIVDRLVASYG
ncbi:MAG: non-hydrolyzing UDP-N-acetylglucosamine 2-epimerase [Acidobacteriota bacterium]